MVKKARKSEYSGSSWSLLWRYFGAQKIATLALFILMLFEIGLKLVIPQIIRFFINMMQARALSADLITSAWIFLVCVVLQSLIRILSSGLHNHISWEATNAIRHDLTGHVLALDPRFHNTHTPGDLLERIDGDVKRLNSFFSELLPEISSAVILAGGTLIVLAFDDWRLSAILFVFQLIFIFIHRWDQKLVEPIWKKERQYATKVSSFVEERVSGVNDIHTSGAGEYTRGLLHEHLRRHALQAVKGEVVTDVGWSISGAFYAFGFALAMGTGAFLYFKDGISLGVVYLIVQYLQLLQGPMTRIGGQFENLIKAQVSIQRINDLFDTQTALQEGMSKTLISDSAVTVELDAVGFGYDAQNAVLHNLSLSLAPGETLGLLGRTGSGKTTVSRLLFRFYDVEQGVIRYNGMDIRDYELASLRRGISLVTQDVQLLHATIRDNITLFQRELSDQLILDSLHYLGLGEWFNNLPEGLDTQLTPGGPKISAGQAQLLAITRAFMKDPRLVILDEASSRVDPVTEYLLDGAIIKLLENRTAVIIAHRLATVKRVDKILILEQGRMKEYGAYAKLSADPDSTLATLLRTGASEVLS